MWNSLSLEYFDNQNSDVRSPYSQVLPYDTPLADCMEDLEYLQRLDLGFGDSDLKRAFHDYALSRNLLSSVRLDLKDRGGSVTMEDSRKPQEFSNQASRDEARKRVLTSLSQNKEEKTEIREMAAKELKTSLRN